MPGAQCRAVAAEGSGSLDLQARSEVQREKRWTVTYIAIAAALVAVIAFNYVASKLSQPASPDDDFDEWVA